MLTELDLGNADTVHNSSIDGWGGEGVYWFEDIDSEDDLAELEIASGFLAQVGETKSDKFWKYRRNAEKHHQHLRETSCCIIRAQTSSTWFFTFWSRDDVFDQSIISFGANCKGLWSILASNVHFAWVAKYGRLMKTDTAYSPSDFFYNFPLPYDPIHDSNRDLADLAVVYQEARNSFCSELQIGMTDLFSRMNDPQNEGSHAMMLREYQKRIDIAVRNAYGFHEIDLDHDFRDSIQGVRYGISEPARREVLQRLLKLNHERYAEEVKQGLHGKKGAAKKAAPKKKASSKPAKQEASLFDGEDDE